MKRLSVLLVFAIGSLSSLDAQSPDPEFAERLKSVMALFDKNQAELKQQITDLEESNLSLTKANLNLFQDLQAAEQKIKLLEVEIAQLRSELSEANAQQLETAALQTLQVAAAPETLETDSTISASTEESVEETSESSSGSNQLVNINTASKEELMTLPTIDEEMAEQIISNRPYTYLEDLIINQQFGPLKLRTVSPHITLD